MSSLPLIVDLDGTVIQTDMLHESVFRLCKQDILSVPFIFYWWFKGKAKLKEQIAQRIEFDPAVLPYNQAVLTWLKKERSVGRRLILCTASDYSIAKKIADYLGIFDEVLASDGIVNLSGENKAKALVQRYGQAGFDYVGDSVKDLPVWRAARSAFVVTNNTGLLKQVAACCEVIQVFSSSCFSWSVLGKTLRLHQWLKNILLFIPLLAAHQFTDFERWTNVLLAFFSFGLCASSVYIVNDLLDLENDRHHPRKLKRGFASGVIPIRLGAILFPLLLGGSLIFAYIIPGNFIYCLFVYFVLTLFYSLKLKEIILLDCIVLAILYTLRIIGGSFAAMLALSPWLLAFSVFLFLSLAFVKRYAELQTQLLAHKEKIRGRGYYTSDAPLIQMFGISSGYVTALVLALYLNSTTVVDLYKMPIIMWGAIPVMLFWISWMWIAAHRGRMHDDPLIFALKEKVSLASGGLFAIVLFFGAVGWPW